MPSESDDPGLLRSFLATYAKGGDVDQVRTRLRASNCSMAASPGPFSSSRSRFIHVGCGRLGARLVRNKASLPPSTQQASAVSTPPLEPPKASSPTSQTSSDASPQPLCLRDQVPIRSPGCFLRDTTDVARAQTIYRAIFHQPVPRGCVGAYRRAQCGGEAKAESAAKADVPEAQATQQAEAAARLAAANKRWKRNARNLRRRRSKRAVSKSHYRRPPMRDQPLRHRSPVRP